MGWLIKYTTMLFMSAVHFSQRRHIYNTVFVALLRCGGQAAVAVTGWTHCPPVLLLLVKRYVSNISFLKNFIPSFCIYTREVATIALRHLHSVLHCWL